MADWWDQNGFTPQQGFLPVGPHVWGSDPSYADQLTPEAQARMRYNGGGDSPPYLTPGAYPGGADGGTSNGQPRVFYGQDGRPIGGGDWIPPMPHERIGYGQGSPNIQIDPGGQAQPQGGAPPTVNRQDPASVAAYVQYYASQPGANPSLARDPNYWIQKISSGELGDDPGYYVSKFMTPEGAPAGSGGFNNGLTGPYGATPFDYHYNADDPSYKFIRDEALNAVRQGGASKGTLNTGGTWKALQDRATGLASTEYGADWQRAFNTHQANFNNGLSANQNYFGQNYQLAGLGLNATNAGINGANGLASNATSYGNLAQNNVNNQGGLLGNQGTAAANGTLGGQNAWNNFYGDLGNLARRYY